MDVLTTELTPSILAEVLHEPERALLGKVLRMLGQERCAAILAATLEVESNGGMLLKDGSRRRTPGGTFFQLVKDASSGKERYYIFTPIDAMRPPSGPRQAPQAPALAPIALTLDLWKGLTPMHVTATLKLVLRDLPETRESNGLVYMALENAPKGLPMGLSLDAGPLYLSSPENSGRLPVPAPSRYVPQGHLHC